MRSVAISVILSLCYVFCSVMAELLTVRTQMDSPSFFGHGREYELRCCLSAHNSQRCTS